MELGLVEQLLAGMGQGLGLVQGRKRLVESPGPAIRLGQPEGEVGDDDPGAGGPQGLQAVLEAGDRPVAIALEQEAGAAGQDAQGDPEREALLLGQAPEHLGGFHGLRPLPALLVQERVVIEREDVAEGVIELTAQGDGPGDPPQGLVGVALIPERAGAVALVGDAGVLAGVAAVETAPLGGVERQAELAFLAAGEKFAAVERVAADGEVGLHPVARVAQGRRQRRDLPGQPRAELQLVADEAPGPDAPHDLEQGLVRPQLDAQVARPPVDRGQPGRGIALDGHDRHAQEELEVEFLEVAPGDSSSEGRSDNPLVTWAIASGWAECSMARRPAFSQ